MDCEQRWCVSPLDTQLKTVWLFCLLSHSRIESYRKEAAWIPESPPSKLLWGQYYSKCGSWTSTISITWKPMKKAELSQTPDMQHQSLSRGAQDSVLRQALQVALVHTQFWEPATWPTSDLVPGRNFYFVNPLRGSLLLSYSLSYPDASENKHKMLNFSPTTGFTLTAFWADPQLSGHIQ